jgi:hypothetical protein
MSTTKREVIAAQKEAKRQLEIQQQREQATKEYRGG